MKEHTGKSEMKREIEKALDKIREKSKIERRKIESRRKEIRSRIDKLKNDRRQNDKS